MPVRAVTIAVTWMAVASSQADSFYTATLDDPKAVSLAHESFGAKGDGVADDTAALQKAIDRVRSTTRQGIVFVPEGRYRLTKAIYVWPGIRLIGHGATRPTLVLGPNTPGYQDPGSESYMVFFAGRPPGTGGASGPGPGPGPSPGVRSTSGRHGLNLTQPLDANPSTFYSAMSNIDLEIQEGNPGAVGVRARYAQHCFLSYMDMRIGSGLAGIHDGGNEIENVRFLGGQYGLITRKPSPGWQLTLVDTTFEGQTVAAIKTHEAGLTLIHPVIRNVPTAISIDPDYTEQLWVKDGRLEDISGPAIVISRETSPRTQINLEDVVCRNVPVFASFRESGKKVPGPAPVYAVKTFAHGLRYEDLADAGATRTHFEPTPLTTLPADKPDLPPLPAVSTWVNVRTLGVSGDGAADDTEAIRKAIADHRVLYFPQGHYRVSDTLTLKPDTVLIGLHPSTTAFVLSDRTPAFEGVGAPKAVIETPRGGTNIVVGLGIDTNGINPRAVGAKWMAGADSMMNDVRFLGGHGTFNPDGSRKEIYNNNATADPNLERRWDGQYPSLWITDGGGGRFVNLWTPSPYAQAGMLVSDTTTPGRVYQMSSEHHVRSEIVLKNVANWSLYALQTEAERSEGSFSLPLEIEGSRNITIANLNIYRVMSSPQPFRNAITVTRSSDIHFRNVHCYSGSKVAYDNLIYDATHDVELRQRELAWLTLSGRPPARAPRAASPILAPKAKVERLASGFDNIAGGAVDAKGDFYFVDARRQRIHRWSMDDGLATVRDNPLDPVNLAFDKAGHLLVLSFSGAGVVYSLQPEAPGQEITRLAPVPAAPRPGRTAVLPANLYRTENDLVEDVAEKKPHHFVSPDGTTFLPAGEDFRSGTIRNRTKPHDVLRAFGLTKVAPGQRVYITEDSQQQTYSAAVSDEGTLTDLQLFADRGGDGVAVDAKGHVYLAAGQILVYDASGRIVDTIEVPERPSQLVFGGRDGRTLFIAARTSLYAVRTRFPGR